MNLDGRPITQVLNNSILSTIHASPNPHYGSQTAIENYQYGRQYPPLGINTVATKLQKKFYGNSTNRSASSIAEKRRVSQIGISFNTLPIKQSNNNNAIYVQSSALRNVRRHGCNVPKKCNHKLTTDHIPAFVISNSIINNPYNTGGNKWHNITHNRWRKFCTNNVATHVNDVSTYYRDYVHGIQGTSSTVFPKLNTKYNTAAITNNIESFGFAKTYTDIRNRYIFQKYNPNGF
jgi:hypothetical protein